jgi:hypothetical protein
MYPEGSQYNFSGTGLSPATWPNPEDVEFVFTSCSSFNCWVSSPHYKYSDLNPDLTEIYLRFDIPILMTQSR